MEALLPEVICLKYAEVQRPSLSWSRRTPCGNSDCPVVAAGRWVTYDPLVAADDVQTTSNPESTSSADQGKQVIEATIKTIQGLGILTLSAGVHPTIWGDDRSKETVQPSRAKVAAGIGTQSTASDSNGGTLVSRLSSHGSHSLCASELTPPSRSPADESTSPIKASTKTADGLALLTIIFAVAAAQILRVVWADDELTNVTGAGMMALKFTSCAAIILNLLAAAASVHLAYQLRHIARNENRTSGRMVQLHFAMLSTVLGIFFVFSEFLLYVLLREGLVMSLVLAGLTASGMAMLAWAFTSSYRTPSIQDS